MSSVHSSVAVNTVNPPGTVELELKCVIIIIIIIIQKSVDDVGVADVAFSWRNMLSSCGTDISVQSVWLSVKWLMINIDISAIA